jgi:hypothetical protein
VGSTRRCRRSNSVRHVAADCARIAVVLDATAIRCASWRCRPDLGFGCAETACNRVLCQRRSEDWLWHKDRDAVICGYGEFLPRQRPAAAVRAIASRGRACPAPRRARGCPPGRRERPAAGRHASSSSRSRCPAGCRWTRPGVSSSAPPSISATATSRSSVRADQCSGVSGRSPPQSSFGSAPAASSSTTVAGAAGK